MSISERGLEPRVSPVGACALTVLDVIEETADSRSIALGVPDAERDRFSYRPGQFLTVHIPRPDGGAIARCYSVSSAPGVDPEITITVKRIGDGVGSNWLCDHVAVGDELEVLPPAGRFTPARLDCDLLAVAAGSGITPIMSIIKSVLAKPTGTVTLLYANRDADAVIFAAPLRALSERFPERFAVVHVLESLQGRPTAALLKGLLAPLRDRDATYLCGPGPFMEAVGAALGELGEPAERLFVETYRSLTEDPFAQEGGSEPAAAPDVDGPATQLTVTLDGERHELTWPADIALLDLLLDRGLRAPFSCRNGECSACACKLVAGEVRMRRNDVLEAEDLDEGWILGCQSVPITDTIEVDYD